MTRSIEYMFTLKKCKHVFNQSKVTANAFRNIIKDLFQINALELSIHSRILKKYDGFQKKESKKNSCFQHWY